MTEQMQPKPARAKAAKAKAVLKTRVWPTLVWMGKTGIPTSSGILLARLTDRISERLPARLRDGTAGMMGWMERTMSMPRGAAFSLALHAGLVAFAYFGLPWFVRDVDFVDIPITVEVVNVTDKTSAPPTRPQKKVTEAKPRKKPAPDPKHKQVKAANIPPPPPPPRPAQEEVAIVPTPEVKPQTKKKPEKTPEKARTTPDLSKLTPPRKPQVKPKKAQDFASVLKTLEKLKDEPQPEKKEEKKKTDQEKTFEQAIAQALDAPQARGTSTEPLSISEIDLVRRQISRCWNMPAGAKGAEDLIVEVKVAMNPDGNVRSARIVDTSRMGRDPFFRAAAETALRAVLNPKCSPLKLPPEKYERWQDMTLTFNPKEMLGL